jgi:hypothetical protein
MGLASLAAVIGLTLPTALPRTNLGAYVEDVWPNALSAVAQVEDVWPNAVNALDEIWPNAAEVSVGDVWPNLLAIDSDGRLIDSN